MIGVVEYQKDRLIKKKTFIFPSSSPAKSLSMQTESHEVSTAALEWSIKEGCDEGLLYVLPPVTDRLTASSIITVSLSSPVKVY